jgi:hypothetical protein
MKIMNYRHKTENKKNEGIHHNVLHKTNKLHNNNKNNSIHCSHTFSILGDISSHDMDSTSEIIESSLPCRSLSQTSLSCLYADRTSFRNCKQKADIPCLSYVYWTMHHCDSWRIRPQLDVTSY